MKGLSCPCPALPHFWQLGSPFMAEGSGPQAVGNGPLLSIQLLRAQYEGLRRQQRSQTHLVVFPKGENTAAPTEAMVSSVWINERRRSLGPEEAGPEAEGTAEEAGGGCLQVTESPWHQHLEMHRLVQIFPQESGHQAKHNMASEQRLPQEGDKGVFESGQMTQPGTQGACQVDSPQTEAVGTASKVSLCPPARRAPHRSGKPAHYPFPQRKAPRISQAARNLGLYGPV
ncbi:PREDICTED: uncharacterized protein C9orf152 homolog [Condylura cristata]|uniref:uncharacterized protein C9orf152 homolog n=1 Tax=Condylura cristata TaxID=143302 RepID=UPI0003343DB0|nr:PREDICTED: uncharacterized protein C9orf152 homolog [Condylura cristata]